MIKSYLENPSDNCIVKVTIKNTKDLKEFQSYIKHIKLYLQSTYGKRYTVKVHNVLLNTRLELLCDSLESHLGYKRVSYVFLVDSITNRPNKDLFIPNDFKILKDS